MTKFKKDELVTYRRSDDALISAIVRQVHRDKSYTVEARFWLRKDGTEIPGYLGYRYRMDETKLNPGLNHEQR